MEQANLPENDPEATPDPNPELSHEELVEQGTLTVNALYKRMQERAERPSALDRYRQAIEDRTPSE